MRFFVLSLLLLGSTLVTASELRSWELQHRSASEMIPIIKPILENDSAISGSGYNLFVRSSSENLDQIDQLIRKLDTAPHMLRITVQQDLDEQRDKSGAELSGSVKQPEAKIYSTQRNNDENGNQQIQVLEGHWATIHSGQAIPQVVQTIQQGPYGSSVSQGVEYRNVESGFEVRPTLVGELVRLDIRPFHARPSPQGGGVIEQQEIVTSVRGKPGEWIELGGVAEKQNHQGTGTIYTTRDRGQLTRNVRIKVEVINP